MCIWFLTTLLVHDSMYLSLRPGPGSVMFLYVLHDTIHCVPGQVLLSCSPPALFTASLIGGPGSVICMFIYHHELGVAARMAHDDSVHRVPY